jgi:hypothetical protein
VVEPLTKAAVIATPDRYIVIISKMKGGVMALRHMASGEGSVRS